MANYFYFIRILLISAFFFFLGNKIDAQENDKVQFQFLEERTQVGFFKEISLDVFGRRDYKDHKKKLKQFLKDADDDRLNEYIRRMEEGDPDEKLEALRNYPFVFYILIGSWYKCHRKNDEKTFRYYSIAKDYAKDNAFLEEDAVLIRKIIKFSKKYESNCIPKSIQDEKGLVNYVAQECINYENNRNKEIANENNKIGVLKNELDTLERKSIKLGNEIDELKEKIKNKEILIKNLTLENYESALNEVNNLSDKGYLDKRGTVVKNLPGGAVLDMRDRFVSDPVRQEFYTSGFNLGSFCTDKMKTSTTEIVSALMKIIDFKNNLKETPQDFKDSIFITAVITGKADGSKVIRNKNGECTLIYRGGTEIKGQYYLLKDSLFKFPKPVHIKDGQPICDEELAFLRAVCSYQEALEIFKKQGILENKIQPKIVVALFNEKGPDYRGVEINFRINNLFTYRLEKIRVIEQEKAIIDRRIKELTNELAEVKKSKKAIEDPLDNEKKIIKAKLKEIEEYKTSGN